MGLHPELCIYFLRVLIKIVLAKPVNNVNRLMD
jgi:hypothetical protein